MRLKLSNEGIFMLKAFFTIFLINAFFCQDVWSSWPWSSSSAEEPNKGKMRSLRRGGGGAQARRAARNRNPETLEERYARTSSSQQLATQKHGTQDVIILVPVSRDARLLCLSEEGVFNFMKAIMTGALTTGIIGIWEYQTPFSENLLRLWIELTEMPSADIISSPQLQLLGLYLFPPILALGTNVLVANWIVNRFRAWLENGP
jgi:hypothetical protein